MGTFADRSVVISSRRTCREEDFTMLSATLPAEEGQTNMDGMEAADGVMDQQDLECTTTARPQLPGPRIGLHNDCPTSTSRTENWFFSSSTTISDIRRIFRFRDCLRPIDSSSRFSC